MIIRKTHILLQNDRLTNSLHPTWFPTLVDDEKGLNQKRRKGRKDSNPGPNQEIQVRGSYDRCRDDADKRLGGEVGRGHNVF